MSQSHQSLDEMTLRELRKVAAESEVPRCGRMRKTELIGAIQAAQSRRPSSAPTPVAMVDGQTEVEAAKFTPSTEPIPPESLASVDEGLPDLPAGYGESRIVLMPRDPQWSYAYWDIPNEHKEELRHQVGTRLALRFYDVTDIDLNFQAPHSLQQYECDEMAREWYLPVPVSDRDYVAEIGYVAIDGRWLLLARSAPVHVPPVYPSDWIEDHFMTVGWDQELRGKTLMTLTHPNKRVGADNEIYEEIFGMAQSAEAQRVAGSLFGSMQHVPGSVISS
ncbi:MAG: DUF4912 domain-containing protein, partial [Leptolyngbyaceae cyanobacterium MO_188.B28]|nr:DUF4912 domain-containing protein [Leptolyngbyaceae cyanobacterium MO_188.B28]